MRETKRCPGCEQVKPASEFHKNRSRPDGLTARCADCQNKRRSEWIAANPELKSRQRATTAANHPESKAASYVRWRERNRDDILARDRARYAANRDSILADRRAAYANRPRPHLLARYGITESDYERMFVEQAGCCAICAAEAARLDVDHSHQTGIVRGLLCRKCNLAIGLLGDDPEALKRAAAYLESVENLSKGTAHASRTA